MIRGKKKFKCDDCGHVFEALEIEWQATVYSQPMPYKAVSLLMIMFLVTSAVSICGPIGFISLGVPNLSRIICKSDDIRKHYLISSAMGIGLLLVTWLIVRYVNFGIYLPISATMAILALPLMAIPFFRKGGK